MDKRWTAYILYSILAKAHLELTKKYSQFITNFFRIHKNVYVTFEIIANILGRGFEPHRRHCVVSLSKNINPSLVLVKPKKNRPFITERLLMGRKESNQSNKQTNKANILRF